MEKKTIKYVDYPPIKFAPEELASEDQEIEIDRFVDEHYIEEATEKEIGEIADL